MRARQEQLQYDTRSARAADSGCSYPALLCQEKEFGENVSEYTHVWSLQPQTVCPEGPYTLDRRQDPRKMDAEECHTFPSRAKLEDVSLSQSCDQQTYKHLCPKQPITYFELETGLANQHNMVSS